MAITAGIKTLLRRFTAADKFTRWWTNQRNYACQVPKRIVAAFIVEYIRK